MADSLSTITSCHLDSSCLFVVDRLIEPQTIAQFLEFCTSGNLPNGETTALPLLQDDDIPLIARPYIDWAPAPYNEAAGELTTQLMISIGSDTYPDWLQITPYNIHSWKSAIWDDMEPLSLTQWREKELDEPENFDLACEYLISVLAAFEYLNFSPGPQEGLKETFNLIYDHLSFFDKAINSKHALNGEQETVVMAALWEEYIRVHYQTIANRANSWVTIHVRRLQDIALRSLEMHQPPDEDTYSEEQWVLTNRLRMLAEININADFLILLPMHDYKGYSNQPLLSELDASLQSQSLDVRREAATLGLSRLTNYNIFKSMMSDIDSPRKGNAHPDSILDTLRCQIDARAEIRVKIRGEPKQLPRQRWIANLLEKEKNLHTTNKENTSEPYQPSKLVIYKLIYSQSKEEWSRFLQKLEEDMDNWGYGVQGADRVKGLLRLAWFDGEELGIAKDDIAAATKHFNEMSEADNFDERNLVDYDFLVVDSSTFSSYMTDKFSMPSTDIPGLHSSDFRPFVTLVDAAYDPDDPELHKEELPGWNGVMRILGSLIWSDLYAGFVQRSSTPMWRWAMDHPNEVYTGRTTLTQVKAWQEYNSLKGKEPRGVHKPEDFPEGFMN